MLIVISILLLVFVLSPALGIALVVAAVALEVLELALWQRWLRRRRVETGAEGMVGEAGVVVEACDPSGTVRVRGEIWKARCELGAAIGEAVRVSGVEGLTLAVDPRRD